MVCSSWGVRGRVKPDVMTLTCAYRQQLEASRSWLNKFIRSAHLFSAAQKQLQLLYNNRKDTSRGAELKGISEAARPWKGRGLSARPGHVRDEKAPSRDLHQIFRLGPSSSSSSLDSRRELLKRLLCQNESWKRSQGVTDAVRSFIPV